MDGTAVQALDNGQDLVSEPVAALARRSTQSLRLPGEPGAATESNPFIKWLPNKHTIEDLRHASDADKPHELVHGAKVRAAYQIEREVTWNGSTENSCGRTLEEDFGLENPIWSQATARCPWSGLQSSEVASPRAFAKGLHQKASAEKV